MPSRAVASAVAVTNTTDSPNCTRAAPPACLAMRPVSTVRGRPSNSISTRWYPGCDINNHSSAARGRSSFRTREGEKEGRKDGELLADPELLDHALVTLEVASLEVVEQAATLSHELEQPTTGVVVLAVHLEVLRQVPDAVGEERDLHLGRPGVARVPAVRLHDFRGALLHDCHPALFVSFVSRWFERAFLTWRLGVRKRRYERVSRERSRRTRRQAGRAPAASMIAATSPAGSRRSAVSPAARGAGRRASGACWPRRRCSSASGDGAAKAG